MWIFTSEKKRKNLSWTLFQWKCLGLGDYCVWKELQYITEFYEINSCICTCFLTACRLCNLMLVKSFLCCKQFWCLNIRSVRCSDRLCLGLSGSLGIFGWLSWALRCSRSSRTAHIVYSVGWRLLGEAQQGLWEQGRTLERKYLSKMKVFKEKSGNYFYGVNSVWTNAPKPNKYLPDRADVCAPKTPPATSWFP